MEKLFPPALHRDYRVGRRPAGAGASAGLKAFYPAGLLFLAGLLGLGAAWLVPAGPTDQYLVMAAPGASRGATLAIILHSGGRLVGAGRLANIALATSSRPGFSRDLRGAGAWVAIPAPANMGCLSFITGGEARHER